MSTPQLQMMQKGRSWMDSWEAHVRHATTGTWFSDHQREQIVHSMTSLENATKAAHGGGTPSPSGNAADPLGILH